MVFVEYIRTIKKKRWKRGGEKPSHNGFPASSEGKQKWFATFKLYSPPDSSSVRIYRRETNLYCSRCHIISAKVNKNVEQLTKSFSFVECEKSINSIRTAARRSVAVHFGRIKNRNSSPASFQFTNTVRTLVRPMDAWKVCDRAGSEK